MNWKQNLARYLPNDLIDLVRQYALIHIVCLLSSKQFGSSVSPSMCVLEGQPYVQFGKKGEWMNPFSGKDLHRQKNRQHDNWIEELCEGEDFFVNHVFTLNFSAQWALQLESTQVDQWTDEEEITLIDKREGRKSKITFSEFQSYVFDGEHLYTCPRSPREQICKHSTQGVLLETILVPNRRRVYFGYGSWTVFQRHIIAVAEGKVLVHFPSSEKWEVFDLDGEHTYATISSDDTNCFLISGGNMYSIHFL